MLPKPRNAGFLTHPLFARLDVGKPENAIRVKLRLMHFQVKGRECDALQSAPLRKDGERILAFLGRPLLSMCENDGRIALLRKFDDQLPESPVCRQIDLGRTEASYERTPVFKVKGAIVRMGRCLYAD